MLFSGKTGNFFFDWHKPIGEFVLGLILFRIVWGFAGSSNAKILPLIARPSAVLVHLKELVSGRLRPERGHNAAGGWAVVLMLLLIGFQAVSGMLIADEEEFVEGRFYGLLDESMMFTLLSLHKINSNLLMTVVIVHISMIAVYRLRGKQNLLSAMITGRMKWPENEPMEPYTPQRWWVGLCLVITVFALVGWLSLWF